MSRSFSNVKSVSGLINSAIARRGYAAGASQAGGKSALTTSPSVSMLKKGTEEPSKTPWVPDPVTGYYRPEIQAHEIDAAELRAMLLKNNNLINMNE